MQLNLIAIGGQLAVRYNDQFLLDVIASLDFEYENISECVCKS